jgi:membrane-associated protease RseP (regulator of RpoE activity)
MLFALGVLALLLGVMLSIALHEVGHLVPAKRSGVKVTQYMVGFGPTLWSRRRGETEYGIKAIPARRLHPDDRHVPAAPRPRRGRDAPAGGEHRLDARHGRGGAGREVDRIKPEDTDRVFYKLPVRRKVLIMLGGPTMNLLIGLTLLTILLLSYGLPKATTVVEAVPDCVLPAAAAPARGCEPADPVAPAKLAGIRPGDRVVGFDGRAIKEWSELQGLIRAAGAREVRSPSSVTAAAWSFRSR